MVVVGAGIIGCAIGYELARRGASVDIVDDRPAGMGATQASAGVLAPYIEAHPGTPLLDPTVRSLAIFDTFVERVRESSGMAVPYRRSGSLEVVTQPDGLARLTALASTLASCGVVAELMDEHSVLEAEPHLSAGVAGGLLVPSHGFVGALSLTEALSAGARHHGARFVRNGRALRIGRAGHELVVETTHVRVAGRAVVLAAGSWSGGIGIETVSDAIPVKPIRGQLVQLAWGGPTMRRVLWGERCYLVPWDDCTLLVGATVEDAGFDERTTAAGVRDLIDAACELVPHACTGGLRRCTRGAQTGDSRRAPGHRPFVCRPEPHVRNGSLSQWHPALAADRPACRRRAARESYRSHPERDEPAAIRRLVACCWRKLMKLADTEIERRLRGLTGWTREGQAIKKMFTCDGFPEAIAFVNRLAVAAEAADHHPDILINYKRVTLTYSTHSEGGLTAKDFDGAESADCLARP